MRWSECIGDIAEGIQFPEFLKRCRNGGKTRGALGYIGANDPCGGSNRSNHFGCRLQTLSLSIDQTKVRSGPR
jgi:hypothetical protein